MIRYASAKFLCRRQMLLKHFGEDFDYQDCNQFCDNCLSGRTMPHSYLDIDCRQHIATLPSMLSNRKLYKYTKSINYISLSRLAKYLCGSLKENNLQKCPEIFTFFKEDIAKRFIRNLIYNELIFEEFFTWNIRGRNISICALKINQKNLNIYLSKNSLMIKMKIHQSRKNQLVKNVKQKFSQEFSRKAFESK